MNKNKTILVLSIITLVSAMFSFVPEIINAKSEVSLLNSNLLQATNQSKIEQKILNETKLPVSQRVLYANNEVIGVVSDLSRIEEVIATIGIEEYSQDFPDSQLVLGDDVFIAEEMLNFQYENIDDQIIEYIVDNDLLAIETNKVTFSNGAVIYVKNAVDFDVAKDEYLLNFIAEDDMKYIKNNEAVPYDPNAYSTTPLSLEIVEKTNLTKGYASKENILKDKREIIEFLSYGYSTDKQFYTIEAFDTVDGIAYQAGISPQQLLTINPNIKSREQLLKEGDEINVTFFDSPINVIVKKRAVKQEVVYPASTLYVNDPTLREGSTYIKTQEETGSKRVVYEETYVNGALKDGSTILDSEILKEPVREVIYKGTMIVPSIGSGRFRYPVDNPSLTCGWYCYAGHTANDYQNRYNRYGSVRASDRGTVQVASYHSINGYYVWINHNNGYRTYYGHFNGPAYVRPGQVVERGEVIGQIGMTGVATGPHVHFMIQYNGQYINPSVLVGY